MSKKPELFYLKFFCVCKFNLPPTYGHISKILYFGTENLKILQEKISKNAFFIEKRLKEYFWCQNMAPPNIFTLS